MQKSTLTVRQQQFVNEYLIDRNATDAARRAGYNPQVGRRLIKNPKIAVAVAARLTVRARERHQKADKLLELLEEIAYRDPMDFVRWASASELLKDAPPMPRGIAASVHAHLVESSKHGKTLYMRLGDITPALRLLAQHVGVYIPYQDEGDPNIPEELFPDLDAMTDEEKALERQAWQEANQEYALGLTIE